MKKKLFIVFAVIFLLISLYIVWGYFSSRVETPNYKVIDLQNSIETRLYEPQLVAQVSVKGERDEAINQGFRLLADYIFGNNISKSQINMTAPVQQVQSSSIAMTAPVQQQKDNDGWTVEFIMPSKYSMETIPKPNNKQVELIQRSGFYVLAIRFSGTSSDTNIDKHLKLLDEYVENRKIRTLQGPIYAFYNPPWTLPILRRNEIYYIIQYETPNL